MRGGFNANMICDRSGEDMHTDNSICSVFGMYMHKDISAQQGSKGLANARLIAAAPDLLTAAHAAKLALDDMQHAKDGQDWWVQRDTAMKQIDAAITKAEAP